MSKGGQFHNFLSDIDKKRIVTDFLQLIPSFLLLLRLVIVNYSKQDI